MTEYLFKVYFSQVSRSSAHHARRQGTAVEYVAVKVAQLFPNRIVKEAEIAQEMGPIPALIIITSILYMPARLCVPELPRVS